MNTNDEVNTLIDQVEGIIESAQMLAVQDLVATFEACAIARGRFMETYESGKLKEEIAITNKLEQLTHHISSRLIDRAPEGTVALVALFNHDNPWVRLRAAIEARSIAPIEATRVLEEARRSPGPLAAEAAAHAQLWKLLGPSPKV